MASTISGYIGKLNPGNGTEYSLGSTAYGVCSTAAGTVAKTVDMTGFTLITGATIFVKFTETNSATNPTLNVNSTGAKALLKYGSSSLNWQAGAVLCLTYDGTSWIGNSITLQDLGLSNAMHFIGKATVAVTDGGTEDPTINGYNFINDRKPGDVIIDKDNGREYVWTIAGAWEILGRDASTTFDSGTAQTNKWISRLEQQTDGTLITTIGELDTNGTWSGNAVTATTASKLSNTSKIGDTNKPVYFKADGTPAAISYTIDKSVPSTAVFTDRYVNSASFAHDSTNNNIKMTLTRAGSDTATVTANIPKISKDTAGVVPKGTEVSSQSQNTKFLREDGTWAVPSYTTNTNTTYTFAEGTTNGAFSVTPSGGSTQSVPIHGLDGAAYKAEDYYVKRSGDTITGNINRYYSATSTDPMITALANNKDIFLFEVGHGAQAGAHAGEGANHYQLKYVGTGASPNNYLQLIASTGTDDIVALQFNENGNAIFNGATRFAIGDNDNTSNKRFIIGSSGKRYLSFGGAGIQAYGSDDTAGSFYLQYNGGTVQIGQSSSVTADTTIYGNFLPGNSNTYALGDNTHRWSQLYTYETAINTIMSADSSRAANIIAITNTSNEYISTIGFHNTGDTNGAIYLLPHYKGLGSDTTYGGKHGLYIGTSVFKWENKYILRYSATATSGNVIIADGTTGNVKTSAYSLGATVNSGTANQVAYYSGANAISSKAPAWGAWTAGTTAGPKANIQIGNATYTSAAIPSASMSASGIITSNSTTEQHFSGPKAFNRFYLYALTDSDTAQGSVDIACKNSSGNQVGTLYYAFADSTDYTKVTHGQWSFREWSPNSTADTTTTLKYETYVLPEVDVGRTTNVTHSITTTKNYPIVYISTAAGTAAKAGVTQYYTPGSNRYLYVKVNVANTSKNALTLSVNGESPAKPIWINNAVTSSSNYTLPVGLYLVYYDGTAYHFFTDGRSATGGMYVKKDTTSYGSFYINREGTAAVSDGADTPTYTNTTGITTFVLGNSKEGRSGQSTSVADNARGELVLYGASTKYSDIVAPTILRHHIHYLPVYSTASSSTSVYGRLVGISNGTTSGENNFSDVGSSRLPVYVTANGVVTAVTAVDTANNLINSLETGSTTPVDADYYIAQYVDGGTTNTTYRRRSMSALWNYIKGHITNDLYWANIKVQSSSKTDTVPTFKTIYFGTTDPTATGRGILTYSSSYPNHGLWYFNDSTDAITLDAHGAANNKTSADLMISGAGIIYTRNRYIPHTGNATGVVGTARNPVYVNAGTITAGEVTFDTLNANRLMWTSAANKPYAGYHYADSTHIAINSTTAPSAANGNNYNLYVSGTARFAIGDNDSSSNKRFIIGSSGRSYLSFGGGGIQAYAANDTASTLWLQYNGGNFSLGEGTAVTTGLFNITTATMTGAYTFNSANGFTYSGIGTGSDNTERPVWFSYNGVTGRPVYDNDFKYNPSLNSLHIVHAAGKSQEFRISYSDTVDMSMMIGTGNENHGLYDHIAGKWMIVADSSGNVAVNGRANSSVYGVCTTAAGTAAKAVTVTPNFILENGAIAYIKFNNTNTAATPTLNISSTGAKSIYDQHGVQITASYGHYLQANKVYEFIYDATLGGYIIINNPKVLELYERRTLTTDLNKAAGYGGIGAMFHLVANANTTTGKTPADANILQMNWDNNGGYDSQLGIGTSSAQNRMWFRSAASTGTDWQEVAHAKADTQIGSSSQPVYVTNKGVITGITSTAIDYGGTGATTRAAAFTNIVAPGGAMTGPLSWTNNTALPAATSADFFLTIDAFADGGKTKYITKANAIKSLVGSSAIGSSTNPIYWTGTGFSATNYPVHYVSQSETTTSNWRKVLLSYQDGSSGAAITANTNVTYASAALEYQPSTGTLKATKFQGPLTGNASTSTQTYVTVSHPSAVTYYAPTFISRTSTETTSGNSDLRASDRYYIYDGGSATSGIWLNIGKASYLGGITFHDNSSYYANLRTTTLTANRTLYMPNATGWLVAAGNGTSTGAGSSTQPVYVSTAGVATGITSTAIAYGGTGATTAAAARSNLGAAPAPRHIYASTAVGASTFYYVPLDITAASSNIWVTGDIWINNYTSTTYITPGRITFSFIWTSSGAFSSGYYTDIGGTLGSFELVASPADATTGNRTLYLKLKHTVRYQRFYITAYATDAVTKNIALAGTTTAPTIDSEKTFTMTRKGPVYVAGTSSNTNYYLIGVTGANATAGSYQLYKAYNSSGSANTAGVYFNGSSGVLYGAAWNDYAEYRETKEEIKPGCCVKEIGDDTLELTTNRLERGCEIVSDTYGFAIGETNKSKTPIAASGRVLAYPYESREEFASHIGWPVCSGPNGTVSIMTEEEEEKYPSRIIGTISAIPDYEEWGTGNVKVNGRVWIRIR